MFDDNRTLEVQKEAATLAYTGDYLKPAGSTVKLAATLSQEADGSLGEIIKAGSVRFSLYDPDGVPVRQETAAVGAAGIVVRYLTGDPPKLADMAAKVLDGETDLKLTDVAIVETAYVLSTVYKIAREAVVDSLIALIQKKNVALFALDKQRALEALLLCRPSNRVSFADAFIWAAARSDGAEAIYSLDERFPEEEIEVRHQP
jgi:predicted nucleic acid-binding protein